MPMPCYLTVTGSVQGEFRGPEINAHEHKILVQSIDHTIEVPTNPQTGQVAGLRVHRPIILCKEIDKSSPLLYQALWSGESLKVKLEFYRIAVWGGQSSTTPSS